MISPEESTGIGERRRALRRDADLVLRVQVDAVELGGRAENLSQAGVFFFSQGALRVTVEIDQDGERRQYPGQLVRVERMSEETTGYAIEFDRA
jgi:hypothetical protein